MKIAHVIDQIAAPGGMFSYLGRISEAMVRDGHQTEIWSFEVGNQVVPGVKLVEIHSAAELKKLAEEFAPDLVNVHDLLDAACMKVFSGLPLVRTLHNNDMYCPSGLKFFRIDGRPCDRRYGFWSCLINHYLKGCGTRRPWLILSRYRRWRNEWKLFKNIPVITFSNFQREKLLEVGYSQEQVMVNHVFAPDPVFRDDRGATVGRPEIYFLFLGRVVPEKGLDWLLQSVAAGRLNYKLFIAGDGYDLPRVKNLAEKLKLNDRVVFCGWVGQEEAGRLLKNTRALVMPSLWHEAAGSSTAEALMAGVPVIISRVGGLQEFFNDGEAGYVINPGDVSGLAGALDKLAGDAQLAASLGQRAREIAARSFCPERHMAELYTIYQDAINFYDNN